MSKIVKVEKNFGDFLVRYNDNKYIGIQIIFESGMIYIKVENIVKWHKIVLKKC